MTIHWEFIGPCDAAPLDNWTELRNTTAGGTFTLDTSIEQEGTGCYRAYYPVADAFNMLSLRKNVILHPSCVLKFWFRVEQIPAGTGGGVSIFAKFTDNLWYYEFGLLVNDDGTLQLSTYPGEFDSVETMSASTWYLIEVDWTTTGTRHVTVKVDGDTWIDEDADLVAPWAVGNPRQVALHMVGEPAGAADIYYWDDVRYGFVAEGVTSYVAVF